MSNYHLDLPSFVDLTNDLGDATALRHIANTPFDNKVRIYKPTHIESIMRNIIGPSFDKMIAEQEVLDAE
jgi:hypothetical protein